MYRLRKRNVILIAFITFLTLLYWLTHQSFTGQITEFGNKMREVSKNARLRYTIKKDFILHDGKKPPRTRNVFYNRVGKCGSRSLLKLVRALAAKNNFRYIASRETDLERPESFDSLQEMMSISNYLPPTFYDRHIHYLDFKRYGLRQPVYINMIRDPIDRFVSQYNYLKYGDSKNEIKSGSKIDWVDINECVMKSIDVCNSSMMFYTGMYFCGLMDAVCRDRNDPRRVRIAKQHIDKEYILVGLLEEFETTLLLLEALLPEYFTGALKVWNRISKETRNATATRKKDVLTEESRDKLKNENLADEYKVYYYVKEKFEKLKKIYLVQNL